MIGGREWGVRSNVSGGHEVLRRSTDEGGIGKTYRMESESSMATSAAAAPPEAFCCNRVEASWSREAIRSSESSSPSSSSSSSNLISLSLRGAISMEAV